MRAFLFSRRRILFLASTLTVGVMISGVFAASNFALNSGDAVNLVAGSQRVTTCDNDVFINPPGVTFDSVQQKYLLTTISVSQVSQQSPSGCGNWIMELAVGYQGGYQMTSWAIPSSSVDSTFYFGGTNTGAGMAKSALNAIDPALIQNIALQMYPGVSCADGGSCAVGDTGPGGGVVVYVSATPITLQGAGKTVTRIEMAPNSWGGATYPTDPALQMCEPYNGGGPLWTGSKPGGWSGYSNVSLPSGLGYGLSNTNKLLTYNTATVSCALGSQAASVARNYSGGGFNDWFLPSADELNIICRYANTLDMTSTAACTAGTVRPGFISTANPNWWSSSIYGSQENVTIRIRNATGAYSHSSQSNVSSIRPIRMF
jgi:hypothetical protein